MANYYDEQEESPLGTVLSNIPNQIMSMMKMKQASEQQALQAETIKLQQDKLRQQVEQQDKLLGKDRAGYGNQALNRYFTDLVHSPIDIRPGEEGWSVDAGIPLPSSKEAWATYQSMVGSGNITEADSEYFKNQLWPNVMRTRASSIESALTSLVNQGFSERDIKLMMMNQPNLQTDIGLVNQYLGSLPPQQRQQYSTTMNKLSQFLPQKQANVMDRLTGLAPMAGGASILGGMGYNLLQKTMPSDIEDAKKYTERFLERRAVAGKDNIIDPKARTSTNLQKSEQALEKAKKIKAKTAKSKVSKATRIKNLEKKISTEKSNVKKILERAGKTQKKKIADKTLWKKGMKYMPKNKVLNFPVVSMAPAIAESTGQFLAGDKGGIIGRSMGGGLQATYGAAKGMKLGQYLMKALPQIAKKKAIQGGAMAMADSPALPFGDVAGMAWGLGSGSYEIYKAYQDWKLANQGY